jgi:hypothetical protein
MYSKEATVLEISMPQAGRKVKGRGSAVERRTTEVV